MSSRKHTVLKRSTRVIKMILVLKLRIDFLQYVPDSSVVCFSHLFLILLHVRNCGSQLNDGLGFLSGVLCGRAISLCPISGMWKRFRVRFGVGFHDHSLIPKSPTNSTFIDSARGSLCISQHVEAVWRYQLSVQVKIKFRVHTLLIAWASIEVFVLRRILNF